MNSITHSLLKRLEVLQPEVDKLCAALRRYARIGMGAALPGGGRLNLLEVAG